LACGLIDEITGEVSLAVDDAQKMIFVNSLAVSTKNFNVTKMRRAMEADNLEPIKEKYLASLRTAELGRIKALNNLRGKNAAWDALIDTAIEQGDTLEKLQPYLNAVEKLKPPAQNQIAQIITEQMNSGAEGVKAQDELSDDERRAAQAKMIVQFANAQV